ncbi:MAG: hypothetical protein HUU38_20280 [Anaerolineales bacterium]|nr:hypothetical protein [Anaerolineales bacterium]
MKWFISYDATQAILFVETQGLLDPASGAQMVQECVQKLNELNCRKCLVDHRGLEEVSHSTMDWYNVPKLLRQLGFPHYIKIANVIPTKFGSDSHFLETVAHNQGYGLIKNFSNYEIALNWLKK